MAFFGGPDVTSRKAGAGSVTLAEACALAAGFFSGADAGAFSEEFKSCAGAPAFSAVFCSDSAAGAAGVGAAGGNGWAFRTGLIKSMYPGAGPAVIGRLVAEIIVAMAALNRSLFMIVGAACVKGIPRMRAVE